jgi:transcriptional regulator
MTEIERVQQLQSEAKRIAAELKVAQEATSPLDRVIAKQTANLTIWQVEKLTARVQARVEAGQSRDEAIDEVLATYRAAVLEALEAQS